MRLRDLEATFVKVITPKEWQTGVSIGEADGVEFLCPACFQKNGGPVGTHMVICWKPHVPQDIPPGPGRWNHQGTSLDDLSLVAGSSSVQLPEPCKAHFFVTGGEIRMA